MTNVTEQTSRSILVKVMHVLMRKMTSVQYQKNLFYFKATYDPFLNSSMNQNYPAGSGLRIKPFGFLLFLIRNYILSNSPINLPVSLTHQISWV